MTAISLERPTAFRALPLVALLALILATLAAVALFGIGRSTPPSNGLIVIGRMDPGRDDGVLYTMHPDGTHVVNLWPETTEGGFWSPDGSEVGFGTARINADGHGYRDLNLSYPFSLFCWDWSPDGKRFLCEGFTDDVAADAQLHGIYTIRASDGGDLIRLDQPGDGGIPGAYSPDGQLVAYTGTFGGAEGALMIVGIDGTGRHRLGAFENASDPRWSPDGKTLLVGISGRLSFVDVATGRASLVQVRNQSPQGTIAGTWSPDGTRLLIKRDVGQVDLYTMRVDGTDLVRITNDPVEERWFDWGTHPVVP